MNSRDSSSRARRHARGLAALAAVTFPLMLWAIVEPIIGHELLIVDGNETMLVGPVPIAMFALGSSLLGWALLAFLEKHTSRATSIWTIVALAVLLLSFLPLVFGDATDTATRLLLAVMHGQVAAVIIPIFLRTSPLTEASTPNSDEKTQKSVAQ